jgi:KaiC/GvpD/RAD55 family RecA-like ATPase
MVSTGLGQLDLLLGSGYPDRSAILVVGPPGIGKEALGYWFTESGLVETDSCLYVTRQAVSEVLEDIRAFHVDGQGQPEWLASEGSKVKVDVNDLVGLSSNIKQSLQRYGDRRARIVTDVVSTLLVLNPLETIYKFLTQLIAEIKQYNAVLLATLEDGMHQPNVLAAMEQIFDGVMELRYFEEGLKIVPLLRIKKMRGVHVPPAYFKFSFANGKMEINKYVR